MGNHVDAPDEDRREDDAQHRPQTDELGDAFHRRSSRTRCTPRILYPRAPAVQAAAAVGSENLVRFATVLPMDPSTPGRFAPIRTKFALPCAFAVITICTLATAPVARSGRAAVARAVFVTPAGDRAEARRAVVSAGGIPEGWVGGRLKAALAERRARGRAPLARGGDAPRSPRRPRPTPIISQGVALSGADALQRSGHDGSGMTIVVLDQAFGAASRLNALAGTRSAADRAPAPTLVRR